jgi:hypothetical protein
MRRRHLLISGAWLLHAVAWFLPAIRGIQGGEIDTTVPGWAAFLYASCAVRPCGASFDTWHDAVLAAVSVVTTLLFIFGSPWVVSRGSRSVRRASAWIATAAFLINAHWYVLWGPTRSDLGLGYYLWWLSFLILAIALFDPAAGRNANDLTESGALPGPAAGADAK